MIFKSLVNGGGIHLYNYIYIYLFMFFFWGGFFGVISRLLNLHLSQVFGGRFLVFHGIKTGEPRFFFVAKAPRVQGCFQMAVSWLITRVTNHLRDPSWDDPPSGSL